MTNRHFPPPWTIERLPGGFKVIDANGQSLAYFYARENDHDANTAGVLTMDEARRMASNFYQRLGSFFVPNLFSRVPGFESDYLRADFREQAIAVSRCCLAARKNHPPAAVPKPSKTCGDFGDKNFRRPPLRGVRT